MRKREGIDLGFRVATSENWKKNITPQSLCVH
jgi:hypothetical protein